MWAVTMVTALGSSQIVVGLFSSVMLALSIRFYCLRQGRIEFGGENLKVGYGVEWDAYWIDIPEGG